MGFLWVFYGFSMGFTSKQFCLQVCLDFAVIVILDKLSFLQMNSLSELTTDLRLNVFRIDSNRKKIVFYFNQSNDEFSKKTIE